MKRPTMVFNFLLHLGYFLWGHTPANFDCLLPSRGRRNDDSPDHPRTQNLKLQQTPLYQIGRIPVKDKARIIYFICPDAEGDGRGPATKTKGPVPKSAATGPEFALDTDAVSAGTIVTVRRHFRVNTAGYRQSAPCLSRRPTHHSYRQNLWKQC
jgi:hypothetical protein